MTKYTLKILRCCARVSFFNKVKASGSLSMFGHFSTSCLKGSLREKCPNTEFFLVRIQSECEKIRTWKNSVFGHFLRSGWIFDYLHAKVILNGKDAHDKHTVINEKVSTSSKVAKQLYRRTLCNKSTGEYSCRGVISIKL